jgi:hypothetical protein
VDEVCSPGSGSTLITDWSYIALDCPTGCSIHLFKEINKDTQKHEFATTSSLSDLKKFKNDVNMRSSTGCFILVVVVAASVDLGMVKQTFESISNRTVDFRNPAGR